MRRRAGSPEATSLSRSAYLAALGAATDGVLLIDRSGVIVYANPAAQLFFSTENLLGQYFADLWVLDRRTLSAIWRELHRAQRWSGRLSVRGASPESDVTVQRIGADADCDEQFCVVLHGAARAEAESKPEPASGLQRVASEIAHDFNNQIAVILNYTFVLLRHMPADSPLKAHVTEMQAAAWRASHVAQAIHRALVAEPAK